MTITAPTHPDFLLRVGPEAGEKSRRRGGAANKAQRNIKDVLRCRTCGALVTSTDQAISRQGGHKHAFFNPAGVAFEVRCFQEAPGCFVQGKATSEFTWFANYQWQYALCGTCLSHLGWFFQCNDSKFSDSFFSLLLQQIV